MIALFFDTETTGFKREDFTPEIVQIAAILQDTKTWRVLQEINLIVTPNGVIPDEAAAIHGITTEFARQIGVAQAIGESTFTTIAAKADVVVAHNIDFDAEMIRDNWQVAAQVLESKKLFCTMQTLTPIMKLPKNGKNHYHDDKYPKWKAPRLQEAYQFFYGRPFEGAHDAMADVRACRDVYRAMHDASLRVTLGIKNDARK